MECRPSGKFEITEHALTILCNMSSSTTIQADKVEGEVESIASLQKRLEQAKTYEEWKKIALRLDELTGNYCELRQMGLQSRFTHFYNNFRKIILLIYSLRRQRKVEKRQREHGFRLQVDRV